MSKHAVIQTQFKNVTVLCEALKNLGIEYTVKGNVVTVDKHAHGYDAWVDLVINCDTGSVKVDDMRKDIMPKITQQYATVMTLDQVKKLGFNVVKQNNVNGTTTITVRRWA